ncbi:undecaprenyl-diphosphate phosphatase, partial [Salipiger bermudensis]|uniref:undecaprenyl-diphosphate phosphatase n=1 Tax=Salipiger bermudensis TaxID=344736 RepID=UPI003516CE12
TPGTARTGIGNPGRRVLGNNRHDAAKIAMLMSIPTILASGALLGLEVASEADASVAIDGLIGAVFAFGAALAALTLMMRLLHSVSFTPYVIYRVILGAGLLIYAYS